VPRRPTQSSGRVALLIGSLLIATVARADIVITSALPIEQKSYPNGLTVVLAPDRSVSTVRVLVRYRGGAADETPERAGYTHLVERLFADGTVHRKSGEHEQRIDAAGGWTTSATTLDDLTLSTEVPPGALELALWLESERMAGLADGLTDASLAKERDAIAAAYRGAYVDQPYGLVARATRTALWPAGHGNRNDILGDPAALGRASLADVRACVRERINPRQATVVIIGNFWPGTTAQLVRRYFGWIPDDRRARRGGAPDALAPLSAPTEIAVADPVAQIVVAYRVPGAPVSERDVQVELQLLAHVLAGSPTSTLERRLVDTGRATEVRAELVPQARGGAFEIHVTPAPGADSRRIAADIRAEVASLAVTPPSAERLAAIRRRFDRDQLLALETIAGRAATVDAWRDRVGLDGYVNERRHRLVAVTPEHLQAAARAWLGERSAVTVIAGPEAR
jgi:zinc protease